ncbi:DUF3422 family protein [Methyloprofundus sp.]|uniref:DUF3422 family protein n=1 Tax=Methyloprofundus sp. TaxID=2020875 RepID=UPI003D0C2337
MVPKLFPIPENHAQRFALHNEIHARPPVSLKLPVSASHLAITFSDQEKQQEHVHLANLCQRFAINPPQKDARHFIASCDNFLLHWEQHGEFSTYCFYVNSVNIKDPFAKPALAFAPIDWLDKLAGQTIVAAHAVIMPANQQQQVDPETLSAYFAGNAIVGSKMTGEDAMAFTDFRIHNDGFSRFIIFDKKLQSQQAGRLLQRLFEIEVYRVMALLALPIAQQLAPKVNESEQRLSDITTAMAQPKCNDTVLLDNLTQLAAEVESHISHSQFRFWAAQAYYKIVEQRITDIREIKIQGIQTIGEFLTKRLQPAIMSCKTTSQRFDSISERISNASQLLRTRVDISIERQNQALLTSMDLRAKIQLRFQETVEGLSIVAITTYIISLLHSSVKAIHTLGFKEFHPDIIAGVAIPFVLIIVAIGVRRLHKVIKKIE